MYIHNCAFIVFEFLLATENCIDEMGSRINQYKLRRVIGINVWLKTLIGSYHLFLFFNPIEFVAISGFPLFDKITALEVGNTLRMDRLINHFYITCLCLHSSLGRKRGY